MDAAPLDRLFPGLITPAVAEFTFVGDGLREALDPHGRR
jgi:ABC-type dipeptide/oligopeptide/nickel transport system permease subunit